MNILSLKNNLETIVHHSVDETFVFGYYDEVSGYKSKTDFPVIRVLPPDVPFYKSGFSKDQSKIEIKFFIYELLEDNSNDRTTAWAECVQKMDDILSEINQTDVGLYITKPLQNPKYHRDGLTINKSVAVEFTFEVKISC